ncbi:MAG: hypothetical protein AAFV86_15825 [Pseudomonadota bacterium]
MVYRLVLALLVLVLVMLQPQGAAHAQTSVRSAEERAALRARLAAEMPRVEAIKARNRTRIMDTPGVFALGIGREDARLVFKVFVTPGAEIPDLPDEIEGVPVSVERRTPPQVRHGGPTCSANGPCHADQQSLPVQMGNSGGSTNQAHSGACTIGFKACDRGTGRVVFVTNSHCHQNTTNCILGTPGLASSTWTHPGRLDVDTVNGSCLQAGTCSIIGEVTGHAGPSCGASNNLTDATKIESDGSLTSNAFRDIGFADAGPGEAMPGDLVRKSGRTTGDTSGEVIAVATDVMVPAQDGFCCGALTMVDQIVFDPTSPILGGDSGSALLSLEPEFAFQVVGLIWGSGDNGDGYANDISRVLDALNLTLNFTSCLQSCLFSTAAEVSELTAPMPGMIRDEGGLVELGHRFRNTVLSRSSEGRRLTSMYYQFSGEAVEIARRNPPLMARTAGMLMRYAPKLRELVVDGQTRVTKRDVEAVEALLAAYGRGASPALRIALREVRARMTDPAVQRGLGVVMVEP